MDTKAQHGNPGDHAAGESNGPTGRFSNAGVTQTTSGASVVSGLSLQQGFASDSPRSLGHATRASSSNQMPETPNESISTDRGDFTCY